MMFYKIVYWSFLFFIGIIGLLLLVSSFPISGNIKFLTVQSGSMSPAIKTGSVVMISPAKDYKIGDVITFGQMSKSKAPITHRINDIKVVGGNPVYITKGDANNATDIKEIQKKDVIGKVLFNVPYFGYAVDFAKKPLGFLLLIIIPAIAIIYDEIKNIWKEILKIKNKGKDKEQVQGVKEKNINFQTRSGTYSVGAFAFGQAPHNLSAQEILVTHKSVSPDFSDKFGAEFSVEENKTDEKKVQKIIQKSKTKSKINKKKSSRVKEKNIKINKKPDPKSKRKTKINGRKIKK
ncbi:MAG: signal peptidase I [bacterium]|nr:signal peptidase I [bacterium]